MRRITLGVGLVVWILVGGAATAQFGPPPQQWTAQTGTSAADSGWGVTADAAGNVYVTGTTSAQMPGADMHGGGQDMFLAKFDPSGQRLWTRQWGSVGDDYGRFVEVSDNGDIFVAAAMTVSPSDPGPTPMIVSFSPDGTELSTFDVLTPDDVISSLAVDGNDVYVASWRAISPTQHSNKLTKYNSRGASRDWVSGLGTGPGDFDYIHHVAVDDDGFVYTTGAGLVTQRDPYDGNMLWFENLPGILGEGSSIAVDDDGGLYVAGKTGAAADRHSYIAKYTTSGGWSWINDQFGAVEIEHVATDGQGTAYLAGNGVFDGLPTTASVVLSFGTDGNLLGYNELLNTGFNITANDLAANASGVYLTGGTDGQIGDGFPAGGYDAYAAKFAIPEPTAAALLWLPLLLRRR